MSDTAKQKKCWLKRNAIDLILLMLAITWFVWAYEINTSTVVVVTLVVASAKAITAYVKWAAIDTGEFLYKGYTYYVVSRERWEKICENDEKQPKEPRFWPNERLEP